MRKIILGLTAAAAIAAPVALAGSASAATIDAAGRGFVGKGEVQTAFGWNNAAAPKNQAAVTFTAKQPTTQALTQTVSQDGYRIGTQQGTQHATQTGTQSGTMAVSQDLTCTFTNGNGTKTFHRDGVREGNRIGTREGTRDGERDAVRNFERSGTRTGTQSGVQSGVLVSALDAADKKTGQYTGWFLKGFNGSPAYSETGAPVWNAPSFGDYQFDEPTYGDWNIVGDFAFGSYQFDGDYTWEPVTGVEWGEWDAAPGENPDDCLRSTNADHVTQISDVVTDGAVTDGAVTDGAIIEGATTSGAVIDEDEVAGEITLGTTTAGDRTNDGSAKVFATYGGVTKGL